MTIAPDRQRPRNAHAPQRTATQVSIAPRTLLVFVALVGLASAFVALAFELRTVLMQFVVAIVLAMALEPLVEVFEKRRLSRGAAVGVAFTLVVAALVCFAYLFLHPLVSELDRFARDLPRLLRELTHGHGRLGFLESRYHVVERARGAVIGHGASGAAGRTLGIVTGTVQTAAGIVFVAFLTLFVLLGGRQWSDAIVGLLPAEHQERVRRTGVGISRAVGGYVSGNVLISVVAGAVATAVLFATHVPYPVPLGLLVAGFDLVPLVGATIGTVIVAAVALTKGVPTAAIVVATMVVYQQVENHALQQVVYHRTVRLSALAITVSVAAGAELGGVIGALLGIPAAGALKVVFAELIRWRREAASARTEVRTT
jgi:predicted PurR-regulated permease PerM